MSDFIKHIRCPRNKLLKIFLPFLLKLQIMCFLRLAASVRDWTLSYSFCWPIFCAAEMVWARLWMMDCAAKFSPGISAQDAQSLFVDARWKLWSIKETNFVRKVDFFLATKCGHGNLSVSPQIAIWKGKKHCFWYRSALVCLQYFVSLSKYFLDYEIPKAVFKLEW